MKRCLECKTRMPEHLQTKDTCSRKCHLARLERLGRPHRKITKKTPDGEVPPPSLDEIWRLAEQIRKARAGKQKTPEDIPKPVELLTDVGSGVTFGRIRKGKQGD